MPARQITAILLMLALLGSAASPTFAARAGKNDADYSTATLRGAKIGQIVLGPRVSTRSLRGKVVVWVGWDSESPKSVNMVAAITNLQAEFGRDKVLIVANITKARSASEARDAWISGNPTNNLVSLVDRSAIGGQEKESGLRTFVFDHSGDLLFDGTISSAADVAREAAKRLPGFLVEGIEVKHHRSEAKKLEMMRGNLAPAVKALRAAVEKNAEDEAGQEAAAILANVDTWAKEELEAIGKLEKYDPMGAMAKAQTMAGYLEGDEAGAPFVEQRDKWKSDDGFQDEVKARVAYNKVMKQAQDLKMVKKAGKALEDRKTARDAEAVLQAMVAIAKRYPDTTAGKEARRDAEKWMRQAE